MTVHPAETPALDWCAHANHYVPFGATEPMAPRSPYRICTACIAAEQAEVAARETFCDCGYLLSVHLNGRCPVEHEARAAHGDR